jgi:hypothetical protein
MDGKALVRAAQHGFESIVRLLLACSRDAPTADCCNCDALTLCRHESTRRLLQEKLLAMLPHQEQRLVMQLPVLQRPEEIVRRVKRKRSQEQLQEALLQAQVVKKVQQMTELEEQVAQLQLVQQVQRMQQAQQEQLKQQIAQQQQEQQ